MLKIGIIVLEFVVIVTFAIFVFSPAPLVYSLQPFSLDKDVYHTHDTMIISSYRCNNEPSPLVVTTVERYFYNQETGQIFELPASPGVIQTGCSWQEAKVVDGFPSDMPSGEYVKRGITLAQGRFRNVLVPWQTESFTYIKD